MKDSRQADWNQPSAPPQCQGRVSLSRIHSALARACSVCQSDQENPAWDYARLFSTSHREAFLVPAASILPHKTVRVILDTKGIHAALAHGSSGSWQQPNPAKRYAISSLHFHLLKAGLFTELYALARNQVFLGEQEQSFPEEPDLPLKTVQSARDAAIEADDPARMAEFCLRESTCARRMHHFDPWQLLDADNPEGALKLVLCMEPTQRFVWLLGLLNHPKAAVAGLDGRLLKELRAAPRMLLRDSAAEGAVAGQWLPALTNHDINLLLDLQAQVLEYQARRMLCDLLIARHQYQIALPVARQILVDEASKIGFKRGRFRDEVAIEFERGCFPVLAAMAEALGRSGGSEAAAVFREVLTLAGKIERDEYRFGVLAAIAEALGRSGSGEAVPMLGEVLAAAREIPDSYNRFPVLTAVAEALGRSRCREAIAMLREVLTLAGKTESDRYRFRVLAEIAEALGLERQWRGGSRVPGSSGGGAGDSVLV